jgi:uncharacterized glyoxalase superfamily protein PhnB
MAKNNFYPVLLTADVDRSSRFFLDHLGFRETFRNEWYISLIHEEREDYELAFVLSTHESVPPAIRGESSAVLLNFEVADATQEYERLQSTGLEIVLALRDEPWGQRHFIGQASPGVMVDVIEMIPPSPEYAQHYAP